MVFPSSFFQTDMRNQQCLDTHKVALLFLVPVIFVIGYGRDYRDRLLGRWGIVDVNACCSCAKYWLQVDSGKVDGERLCITGGSAGGYTALAALASRETFKAGSSLYSVNA
ncbi:unnamed protein product [Fraxinus pennsylvanica]|uniref:Peptidase S9 prolyl oligopeptidase catalytic domain-containing protein n=1 Tax=Fraxinus pennsylvanica TaxID=56036 RepID=A0AAD1Z698_9LAMI|nr:unnamed protein product [Fraxinus pennsylvanica]